MPSDLLIHSARLATQRAHLAGAEAAELQAEARASTTWAELRVSDALYARARAARRRYWRELASASLLIGHPWPAAERLGSEPQP